MRMGALWWENDNGANLFMSESEVLKPQDTRKEGTDESEQEVTSICRNSGEF